MGFLGFRDGAPPPPAADEPPGGPDEGGDDTGIHITPSLQSVREKYRRKQSWLGRYAWLISIGAHVVVLLVAYIAFRQYFQPAVTPAAPVTEEKRSGSFIAGGDATDRVHGLFGRSPTLTLNDSLLGRAAEAEQEGLSFSASDPQTVETLRADPNISSQALEPRGAPLAAAAPAVRWWADPARPAATQPDNTSRPRRVN